MSYVRPYSLQPKELRQTALDSWLRHVFHLIRDNHILANRWKPAATTPTTPMAAKWDWPSASAASASVASPGTNSIQATSQWLTTYFDSMVPRSMQEEAFHRGAQMLRKEELFCGILDMFAPFFCLFWKPSYRLLNIPSLADDQDRLAVLESLVRKSSSSSSSSSSSEPEVESAKFRLFDTHPLSMEESYLMKRALRSLRNLRVLVLWKVADDAMLAVIGATCRQLEAVDVWRSASVTDMGLKFLLSFQAYQPPWIEENLRQPQPVSGNKNNASRKCQQQPGSAAPSELCHTLKRISIKETSCSHIGSVFLIVHCQNLEILDFSHGVVVKEFLVVIRDLYLKNRKTFSLKTLFLPVTSSDILHDVVNAFPNLEDLRLWTSMTQMRGLRRSDFPHLHSLMLGGLHSNQLISDLVTVWGPQLTALKLETVSAVIPLEVIGRTCTNLVELQLINARLSIGREHVCSSTSGNHNDDDNPTTFLARLKLVYFFLIQYVVNDDVRGSVMTSSDRWRPKTALHCVLRHARHLEGIQATGTPTLTDEGLENILTMNPLKSLRRFILTDAVVSDEGRINNEVGNQQQQRWAGLHPIAAANREETKLSLTSKSVILLFETCQHLQCAGDLRHWSIPPNERRQVFRRIQFKSGSKCMEASGNAASSSGNRAETSSGEDFRTRETPPTPPRIPSSTPRTPIIAARST